MTATTIDLAIITNIQGLSNLETHPELPSDHNPIFFHLQYKNRQNVQRQITSYKHINWGQYRQLVNDKLKVTPKISSIADLERTVEETTTTLQDIKNTVTKQITVQHEDTLPDEILDLIKIRNRHRKIWQRTGIITYRDRIRELTYNIKSRIKEHKNKTWTKKLENLSSADNSIWEIEKALKRKNAFDKVWIAGLIHKLFNFGYSPNIIHLISSYLTNRTMCVKINNTYSRSRTIAAGVPQGSVLGPVLFNIYIRDIPTFHNSNLALFADDTALYVYSFYAQAAGALTQCHLDRVVGFYKEWKIKLNVNKSEVIVFRRKFTNNKLIRQLRVGSTILPQKIM